MKSYFLISFIAILFSNSLFASSADNYEKALMANTQGNVREALIHIKNSLQEDENYLPARILLGEIYFQHGESESAEDELQRALDSGADINLVIVKLGYALLAQEKTAALLSMSKYEPNLNRVNKFEWILIKALAYALKNDDVYTQIYFEQALEIFPTEPRAINAYASFLIKSNELDLAKSKIEQSIEIDPERAKTWSLLGEYHLKLRQSELANKALLKGYELDDTDPKIIRLLAFNYMKQKDFRNAERFLDRVLEFFPEDASATLMKAWIMANRNETDLAQQSLNSLENKLSLISNRKVLENNTIMYVKGASQYVSGDYQQARESLNLFLSLEPSHFSTIQMLSHIYQELDGEAAAIRFLESKKNEVIEDFSLSVKLLHFYVSSDQLFTAREFLSSLQYKYADNPYINYVSALVEYERKNHLQALSYLNKIEITELPISVLILKGKVLLSLNKFEDALVLADNLDQQYPNSSQAQNFIASYYLQLGELTKAKKYLDRVLTLDENNLLARYNTALVHYARNEFMQAESVLQAVLVREPNHVRSRILLTNVYLGSNKLESALQEAHSLSVREESRKTGLELSTEIYMLQKNWSQALKVNQELLSINKIAPVYLSQQIEILSYLDRKPEAITFLNLLKGLYRDSEDELYKLANLYKLVGKLSSAIDALKLAEREFKLSKESRRLLAELYALNKQFDLANTEVLKYIKEFGQEHLIVIMQGDIAFAEQKYKTANKNYYLALKIKPDSQIALIRLYQLAKRGIGVNKFSQLLEKDISAEPVFWKTKLLADHYMNNQQLELAKHHYLSLVGDETKTSDSTVLNNLANIYLTTDLNKALEYAQQAYQLSQNNPNILDTYAWVLARKNKFKQALPLIRSAYSMNANNPEITYHLAYILHGLGRSNEAEIELNKIRLLLDKVSWGNDAKQLLAEISKIAA